MLSCATKRRDHSAMLPRRSYSQRPVYSYVYSVIFKIGNQCVILGFSIIISTLKCRKFWSAEVLERSRAPVWIIFRKCDQSFEIIEGQKTLKLNQVKTLRSVNPPHQVPVTRQAFPYHSVFMKICNAPASKNAHAFYPTAFDRIVLPHEIKDMCCFEYL